VTDWLTDITQVISHNSSNDVAPKVTNISNVELLQSNTIQVDKSNENESFWHFMNCKYRNTSLKKWKKLFLANFCKLKFFLKLSLLVWNITFWSFLCLKVFSSVHCTCFLPVLHLRLCTVKNIQYSVMKFRILRSIYSF